MRRFIFALLALAFAGPLAAQQRHIYVPPKIVRDTSTFWIFKDLTLGPYFTAGTARQNEKLPDSMHSSPKFSFVFGGVIDGAINNWLGLSFGLLWDSRDLYLGYPNDADNIDLNIDYLAIQPSVRIFWLLVGLAIDIPMSGSANELIADLPGTKDRPELKPYNANIDVPTGDLSTLVDARATLSIPVIHGESGTLHLIFSGNYPLGKTVASTSYDTTGSPKFSAIGAGPLPTLEAGLSYQFDLLH